MSRQRQNRLIAAVLEHPQLIGVGIDEATALWVRPAGSWQVLGEGVVMVVDARRAGLTRLQRSGSRQDLLGVSGMEVHILLPGDEFASPSPVPPPRPAGQTGRGHRAAPPPSSGSAKP